MATRKNQNVQEESVNIGGVNFSKEQLDALGPEMVAQMRKSADTRKAISGHVAAVSESLELMAQYAAKYNDAAALAADALAALREAGGSVVDVPEYASYREANGLPIARRGKPTSLETIANWLANPEDNDAAEDDDAADEVTEVE